MHTPLKNYQFFRWRTENSGVVVVRLCLSAANISQKTEPIFRIIYKPRPVNTGVQLRVAALLVPEIICSSNHTDIFRLQEWWRGTWCRTYCVGKHIRSGSETENIVNQICNNKWWSVASHYFNIYETSIHNFDKRILLRHLCIDM